MFGICSGQLDVCVRVTPKSAADNVDGVFIGADGKSCLALRVRALPDKGKANKAVIALFADWARCAKRDIDVVRGATARIKTLRVSGSADQLTRIRQQLEALTHER